MYSPEGLKDSPFRDKPTCLSTDIEREECLQNPIKGK